VSYAASITSTHPSLSPYKKRFPKESKNTM
jgi:hypothetical protein